MKVLIVGATGATGRLLVRQMLDREHDVTIIVRSPHKVAADVAAHPRLTIVHANLLDLSQAELTDHVRGCDAIASCLGHVPNLKGIYGQPRRLVTEATRRLCAAAQAAAADHPVRFVLMNTAGNSNRDLDEPLPAAHRAVIALLRLVLPPHVDNEKAADYLRTVIGQNDPVIEWVAVRPDNLIDEDAVTTYTLHPSPTRSAILDPGKTSRINVAHVMAALMTDDALWATWRGQMPVIYNAA